MIAAIMVERLMIAEGNFVLAGSGFEISGFRNQISLFFVFCFLFLLLYLGNYSMLVFSYMYFEWLLSLVNMAIIKLIRVRKEKDIQ